MNENKIMTAVVAIIFLLVAVFILQNLTLISVKFLFWSFEIRRFWLVFFLFLAGLVSGLILAWLLAKRNRRQDEPPI